MAVPVVILDRLDLLLAQAKVVADLVDERLRDGDDEILAIFGFPLVRALKKQNPVGQRVAVVRTALCQRRALVQPEKGIGRFDIHLAQEIGLGFVLHHDGDVTHRIAEAERDVAQGFSDGIMPATYGNDIAPEDLKALVQFLSECAGEQLGCGEEGGGKG